MINFIQRKGRVLGCPIKHSYFLFIDFVFNDAASALSNFDSKKAASSTCAKHLQINYLRNNNNNMKHRSG